MSAYGPQSTTYKPGESRFQPGESRPDSELAVVFINRLHVVRLFRSELELRETYFGDGAAMRRDTFLSHRDLGRRFSLRTMVRLVDELTTPLPYQTFDARDRACGRPDFREDDPLSVCCALWDVLHQVGDLVRRVPAANSKPQDDYDFAVGLMTDELVKSFPRQARVLLDMVMREAVGADRLKVPEDRLKKLVEGLAARGELKTKQEPWRIMQFYCGMMHEAGVLEYPGRRRGGDSAEDPGNKEPESTGE